ncbi:glycosyltransferase family 4 protein [Frigidibacter sp. MR17.14]|uniref:glycosyltransferase family 4 protein n=1 Tax=Frigidibacter sp. MR17.14 TaxID=3126509 RepID=UPI003012CE6E
MTGARLLQITDKGPRDGGVGRVVSLQAAALSARGWTVTRLRLLRPGSHAGGPADPAETLAPVTVAPRLAPDAPVMAALERAAAGAALIHLHLGFASLSPELIRRAAALAPLAVSLHDVSPFLPPRGEGLAARLRRRWLAPVRAAVWSEICASAACLIAPSRFLAGLAAEAGFPPGRIALLPLPVEAPGLAPVPASACPPLLVYAGLLDREKGAVLAVEVMARLRAPAARLLLLGDGPAREALRARAAALPPGRVRLAGRQPPSEVARQMAGARAVLFPSRVPEGLGLSGLEALALARPVIGYPAGGAADWLRDGETGLVPGGWSPQALATAIDRLLDDPALADRLGRAGQALVAANHDPGVAAEALQTLFQSLIGPHRRVA